MGKPLRRGLARCTRLASIHATPRKWLLGTVSRFTAYLPPPHPWKNSTVTPDRVSVTHTSSFSQGTSGVFAGIKIKKNAYEAKGK